jgi:hypothetical protein
MNCAPKNRARSANSGQSQPNWAVRFMSRAALAPALKHRLPDLERNQFGRESGEPLRLPFRPAILDPNVASL